MTNSRYHCPACEQRHAPEDRDDAQRQNRPPRAGHPSATQPAPPKRRAGRGPPLWLNQLPEVQAILAAHFAAKPIDESNLSHWKQGGYPEWEAQEQAQRTALAFLEAQPGEPKQERIRQIMGIGEDYGPAAAPESLLTTATRTLLN